MYQRAKQVLGERVQDRIAVPPQGFGAYLRWRAARGFDLLGRRARGLAVWLIWGLDGLLVLAATVLLVAPALRQPYCNRCQSWFRTTRNGAIDVPVARRLAAAVHVPLPDEVASARYRLVTCRAGCGPTGFELRWQTRGGESSSARVWLDAAQRDQAVRSLDQGAAG
jgi:hypothetical protein